MRRALEVVLALMALVLLSPVLLLVGILVRMSLGSPVLFRQVRVGLGGREFMITKFRTLGPQEYAGQADVERETRMGRLLRMTSLDELPQLWNVVVGDMGLIGPRPTLPEQVRHYSTRQRRRLAVRPGLTGWAQVHGRNSISWPERIELDLHYIEHRTLAMDAEILFRTVATLLRPGHVYGPGGVNQAFPVPDDDAAERQASLSARPTADGGAS